MVELRRTEPGVPMTVSETHEEHELASKLLLKPGEECWDTYGYFLLDEEWRPVYIANVCVAVPNDGTYTNPPVYPDIKSHIYEWMPGEKREGIFIYDGQEWKYLYQHITT